jgi:hypothetical protein
MTEKRCREIFQQVYDNCSEIRNDTLPQTT